MNKVLVTGVTQGIGHAICSSLISQGYFIIGVYNTSQAEADKMKDTFSHKQLDLHQVDLADRKQTLSFVKKINEKYENLHGIVNNAGTFFEEDFNDFDLTGWDTVFEVNVNAPLILSTGLISKLSSGSSIVNISSTDGFTGSFGSMAYSASKSALSNLTKSLGNNLGKNNIRVNAICPGWIDTGMSTDASYKATELTPLKRNGRPEEVADLVSYLLSDKSSFINGANLFIDGGYTNVDAIMKEETGDFTLRFEK